MEVIHHKDKACIQTYIQYIQIYHITPPRKAGALIRTLGTMCFRPVWLGNKVEAMEFLGDHRQRKTSMVATASDEILQDF